MKSKNLNLLIETATERGAVFILEGACILYKKELPFGLNNSKFLLPTIQEGFQALDITAQELSFIGVGLGPGSYTGIRVGAITAKTLAYTCKIPLVGICTLACFAPARDAPFAAVIDAKIGGAYVLKGLKNGGAVQHFYPPQVCELEKFDKLLGDVEVLVTPNSAVLRAKMQQLVPQAVWEWHDAAPDPFVMGRTAYEKFRKGEFSRDGRLELMYLRKTQAEIEKEARENPGSG